MRQLDRRQFIAHGLVGVGAVWAGLNQNIVSMSAPVRKQAADQVLLGTSGDSTMLKPLSLTFQPIISSVSG